MYDDELVKLRQKLNSLENNITVLTTKLTSKTKDSEKQSMIFNKLIKELWDPKIEEDFTRAKTSWHDMNMFLREMIKRP